MKRTVSASQNKKRRQTYHWKPLVLVLGLFAIAIMLSGVMKYLEYAHRIAQTNKTSSVTLSQGRPTGMVSIAPSTATILTPSPVLSSTPASSVIPSPSTVGGLVYWSPGRKLTWDDYRGPIGQNGQDIDAETSAGFNLNWQPRSNPCRSISGNTFECTVKIESFTVQTVMDQNKSWVKPNVKSSYLLDHEQLHFNIVELYARKMRNQMNGLVGQTETAQADGLQAAEYEAAKRLNVKFNTIFDAISQEVHAVQATYDNDTSHGLNHDAQTQWDQKIHQQL